MKVVLLLTTFGITVTLVIRILEVPLLRPGRARRRTGGPWGRSAASLVRAATRKPDADQEAAPANLRGASSRLVFALVLLAAAGALLIVLVVRWLGSILQGITS